MVVWGLGLQRWCLELGFWGWGFQLTGSRACGVGLSGFFGVEAFYKHKNITLGTSFECWRGYDSVGGVISLSIHYLHPDQNIFRF